MSECAKCATCRIIKCTTLSPLLPAHCTGSSETRRPRTTGSPGVAPRASRTCSARCTRRTQSGRTLGVQAGILKPMGFLIKACHFQYRLETKRFQHNVDMNVNLHRLITTWVERDVLWLLLAYLAHQAVHCIVPLTKAHNGNHTVFIHARLIKMTINLCQCGCGINAR